MSDDEAELLNWRVALYCATFILTLVVIAIRLNAFAPEEMERCGKSCGEGRMSKFTAGNPGLSASTPAVCECLNECGP